MTCKVSYGVIKRTGMVRAERTGYEGTEYEEGETQAGHVCGAGLDACAGRLVSSTTDYITADFDRSGKREKGKGKVAWREWKSIWLCRGWRSPCLPEA